MLLPACWCSLCQPCSEPAHIQMQRQILTASSPISEGMRQPLEGEGEEVVASLLKGHHTLAACIWVPSAAAGPAPSPSPKLCCI